MRTSLIWRTIGDTHANGSEPRRERPLLFPSPADFAPLCGLQHHLGRYRLNIGDGVFAGTAAKVLLADKGYDADWLRHALAERRMDVYIALKPNSKT